VRHQEREREYSSKSSYKAWLNKPNQARLETRRTGDVVQGVLVGDNDYFWMYWPHGTRFFTSAYRMESGEMEHDVYMKKRTPQGRHSLGHEIHYIGAECVMDLSCFHGYEDSLTPYLEEIRFQDTEDIRGETCDVIRLSFMKGQRERILWLSRKDHLPRKLKSIVHVAYDIFTDEEWTQVRINDEPDPALFEWTPPEDWKERKMPDPDDALLGKGDAAPAFVLTDALGNQVKFADFLGKPLWLMFWRVG